jgi:hypothetical protein
MFTENHEILCPQMQVHSQYFNFHIKESHLRIWLFCIQKPLEQQLKEFKK